MSNSSAVVFPNVGSHAWLHRQERSQQVRLGDHGGYPLPKPTQALTLKIQQRLGFNSEPRAFWYPAKNGEPDQLEWGDLGVFAPLGPLPEHLTESLLQDAGGARVHRLVSELLQRLAQLYYRSWAQLRPECEIGRSDDRFTGLLGVLAGESGTRVAQLPNHRPPLHQLPQLALAIFGIVVRIEHPSVTRLQQSAPSALGTARLGYARLGQHLAVFGLGDMRLWMTPKCAADFFAWSDHRHAYRQRFEQFLRQFLPVGARCDIRVQTPIDMPQAQLSQSALGRSCLAK